MSSHPLRLLLYVDSLTQPRWVDWMLRDVVASGVASIAAVVVNAGGDADAPATRNRALRLMRNWRALPYAAFLRYDARHRGAGADPFEPTSIEDVITGAAILEVTPRRTRFSDFLSDETIERLRALDVDVGLRLGFRILRGGALTVARHGIWSFHHGDNRAYRGGPAGFWEVVEGALCTGAILQRLSEDLDGGLVLFRTCVPTDPISPARNRHMLYWAAARGLRPALARLSRGVEVADVAARVVPYGGRMYGAPTAAEATRATASLLARRIARRLRGGRRHEWRLGVRFDRLHAPGDPPDLSPHRLRIIPAPAGSLEADPFVVRHGDEHLLFFEQIAVGETRGTIALRRIDQKGRIGDPVRILERPHHLSYPTVLEWEGSWYMIAESYEAGCQEVFRATAFPLQWELHARWFVGEPVVDPSIVCHDGRWWLFASRPVPQTLVGDELHVFHAPTPLGPWTPHLLNPVRAGVDGSRPAGVPFMAMGRLVRPGQIGAPQYGAGVRFFEIAELSPDRYEERDLGAVHPAWSRDVGGYHTINSAGHVTVGDVLVVPGREAGEPHG